MKRIIHFLVSANRSLTWLTLLVKWVKGEKGREPNFWRSRLHVGDRAVKQLADHLERGELPAQYDAHLAIKYGAESLDETNIASRNHLFLIRHYDFERQTFLGVDFNGAMVGYEDCKAMSATAGAGIGFTDEDVALEMGDFKPVGKGFDVEEAE